MLLFVAEISQFQKIVGGLIELVDELAKEAETEKMKVGLKINTCFFFPPPSGVGGNFVFFLALGYRSQKPAEVCSKTEGGSTTAAPGSHFREKDAAWTVKRLNAKCSVSQPQQ